MPAHAMSPVELSVSTMALADAVARRADSGQTAAGRPVSSGKLARVQGAALDTRRDSAMAATDDPLQRDRATVVVTAWTQSPAAWGAAGHPHPVFAAAGRYLVAIGPFPAHAPNTHSLDAGQSRIMNVGWFFTRSLPMSGRQRRPTLQPFPSLPRRCLTEWGPLRTLSAHRDYAFFV